MSNGWGSVTGTVATYVSAGIAMLGTYGSHIVQVLGFILLVSRLVVEVPRAYDKVRSWFRKENADGSN